MRSFLSKAFPVVLLATTTLLAQNRSRITARIDDSVVTRLPGSTHRAIRDAATQDTGRVAPDLALNRLQLVLTSSPEQLAALEQLLRDQQDPSSPRFHQWLTPQQFGEQFGPSQAELDAVTGWLGVRGFSINRIANGRRSIEFNGTVAQVEQSFHTEMHHYVVNGEAHIANATDVSVPTAFAGVIGGVLSLHDFRARPQHHVLSSDSGGTSSTPAYTSAGGTNTLTPYDFATIYDLAPVWNGLGSGRDRREYRRRDFAVEHQFLIDVNEFRSDYGLPPASVKILLNGDDPGILGRDGR